MKVAASIFSWLGGLVTTIYGFYYLSQGTTVTVQHYSYYYGYTYTTEQVPYPSWVWVLWVVFLIIRLIILIWRESAVKNGNKIGCVVCTLLFASLIGGILTLCIPVDQPTHKYYPKTYSSNVSSTNEVKKEEPEFKFVQVKEETDLPIGSFVEIINGFYAAEVGQRVNDGDLCEVIDVYGEKIRISVDHISSKFAATTDRDNILLKVKNPKYGIDDDEPQKPTDKFEEIRKYKELLDEGIITQEEFDKKKEELLK